MAPRDLFRCTLPLTNVDAILRGDFASNTPGRNVSEELLIDIYSCTGVIGVYKYNILIAYTRMTQRWALGQCSAYYMSISEAKNKAMLTRRSRSPSSRYAPRSIGFCWASAASSCFPGVEMTNMAFAESRSHREALYTHAHRNNEGFF